MLALYSDKELTRGFQKKKKLIFLDLVFFLVWIKKKQQKKNCVLVSYHFMQKAHLHFLGINDRPSLTDVNFSFWIKFVLDN